MVPNHAGLLSNIGNVLLLQGEAERAISWLNKAIARDPNNATAQGNLGNALFAVNEIADAVAAYRRAVELNPRQTQFLCNLGRALIELGEFEQAIDSYHRALEIDQRDSTALRGLGKAWGALGNLEKAVSFYQTAIDIDPGNRKGYVGLAEVYADHGESEQAVSLARTALQLDPQSVSAYLILAKNKKFTQCDADLNAMESLYLSKKTKDVPRSQLGFALSKAYEDFGESDQAMGHLVEAARLRRGLYDYSLSEFRAEIEQLKEGFSPDFIDRFSDGGTDDPTPIFILGMPRSGTSLVEQILASHPEVYGAGEITLLQRILGSKLQSAAGSAAKEFPAAIHDLKSEDLRDIGIEYIARIRRLSAEATFITDKLPHNFLRVGLIRVALPNARVIQCTREPVDNCFSIFKTDFKRGHPYSYDLCELGQYFRLYQELMEYWKNTLPGFVYELNYETLVADQEAETRKLLQHCNLPWSDACLDFHETRRKIATASNTQVTRPIYRDSINRWARYEKYLQPLIAELNG